MTGNIFKEIGDMVKGSPLHTLSEGIPLTKPEVFDEPLEINSQYAKEASGEWLSDDKKDELKKDTGWSDKGLAKSKSTSVVELTIRERKLGTIPDGFYVIEDLGMDGIIYAQNENGEIVELAPHHTPKKFANSLQEYIYKSQQ